MLRPISLALLLTTAAHALPAPCPARCPAPGQEPGQEPVQEPAAAISTEYELLLRAHLEGLGGQERLEALHALRFELAQTLFIDPEAEGEAALAGDPAARVATEGTRLAVEMELGSRPQRMRIEEEQDGLPLVQIVSASGPRVWVEGQESSLPTLQQGALEQAALITIHFDMVMGLVTGAISGSGDGMRKRDGVEYRAIQAQFHPTRGLNSPLRFFVHPETLLVERVDIFELETKRRLQSVYFRDYVELEGLQLPTRVEFLDREGQPELTWVFEDLTVDPEIEPARFEGP